MPNATLRSVGGSIMVAIPKAILDGLGLSANEKVEMRLDGQRLVIEPRRKPKYSLGELLAQCSPDAGPHPDVQAWDEAEAVGRETI